MTLIQRIADNWIGPGTTSGLAGIRQSTQVAVVTTRAVGFGRVGAQTGTRVAYPGVMTRILGSTDYRIVTGADADLTTIRLGAQVTVITCRPVRAGRIRANTGLWIAAADIVTLV